MKEVILTDEGLRKLEAELEHLIRVRRSDVAEKIKVALSFGDLSENSEYDEAKNEQAMVESRISQLEAMLKNVRVLDEDDLPTDMVHVGSKLLVRNNKLNKEVAYQIVGSTETDPSQGKISDESPVGKALLGHKVGDVVEVEAPVGTLSFEILDILK